MKLQPSIIAGQAELDKLPPVPDPETLCSALELIGLCTNMILGGCLRGAGDTRTPMIVTLVGTMLFRVPLTYLFVLVLDGGLSGVWLATAVDWSMRSLVLCLLYLRGRWKTVTV